MAKKQQKLAKIVYKLTNILPRKTKVNHIKNA